ncbi:uncharacterized protein LOC129580119 [Sitodiplosis mosellana]|uniref:uncharacterized protein LOC129580119 n=1 Tax=Sitodiplosis mosellana TaxID=263140 RepID=UPI0024449484|nr:uncharacterized protein LOC129580119 [Sitodiplosis mosellana]
MIASKSSSALLATAIVRVVSRNGEKLRLRALIDPGSQSAFITESAAQLLRVPRLNVSGSVSGIGNELTTIKNSVMITAYSRFSDDYFLTTEAVILPKLTGYVTVDENLAEYDHLANLRTADVITEQSGSIDLLLGVVEYTKILKAGLIKSHDEAPVAQNSELGWLIMGAVGRVAKRVNVNIASLVSNVELDKKLAEYFADNDVLEDEEEMSAEEQFCENFYQETTSRNENGVFTVKMPFKDGEPVLGESKKCALATLFSMEKRFAKAPNMKKLYVDSMNEAIESGHMERVEIEPKNAHFIPHHAVMKDSTTTKLRIVHNASQKTSNGRSLNSQLAIGKMEQATILTLILRNRQHKIAFVGDIEKMYKQIKLHESQQHLQMVLWRENTNESVKMYKLTTVMFGLGPAPFLAIRTLKELANEVEREYPLASLALKNNFYVDDYSDGADTVQQALDKCSQLKLALKSAGFNLRKFASNSAEFLAHLPEAD